MTLHPPIQHVFWEFLVDNKAFYSTKRALRANTARNKWLKQALKLQIIFKNQNKLSNIFRFKDPIPTILRSGVVYKFQCGLCNESYYGECVRHLAVRSGEHIGISPLTSKRVQPRKDSAVCHHLLNCNYSPTFEDFSVLCHENEKYLLELKGNLVVRDWPSLNWNIGSTHSICLNTFLSHCLLHSVDFYDQFPSYFT